MKLRVADRTALLRRLARLKFKRIRTRVHEMNVLYDTVDGALARREQMLRIRLERPASRAGKSGRIASGGKSGEVVTLTYKGPVERPAPRMARGRYKVRDEREVRLDDARAGERILAAFDLVPRFRYEKFRTTYQIAGGAGVAELDETPIGTFLELEGSGAAIDRAARALGFGPADYILQTYVALYMEQRGEKRRARSRNESRASLDLSGDLPDMLFLRKRRENSQKGK